MQRRDFIAMTGGAVAAGVLGCAGSKAGTAIGAASTGTLNAAAFHASRQFVATRFGRIAFVERGSGPAALFIHGLPLANFQWRGALERLAPMRRCLAPDSMGLGYSEIPEGQSLAPEAQAEMFAAFLDALGIRSVDLVANDSGGAIAQIFVAHYPERVRTLLLTNCDVHTDSPPPVILPVIEASRAGTFVDQVILPQLRDKRLVHSATGLGVAYTYPGNPTDEAIDYYFTPVVSSPLRVTQFHKYCIEMMPNPLVALEPALRRCPAPLRVVWGTGDTIFSAASPDWLDRTFPHSRGVRRLAGANLFFPEEMPDTIAEEARRLWQS